MSFSTPLVLLGLLAIPLLVTSYARQQRRHARAADMFVAPKLAPSVVPRRPGWRRHAPMLALAVAITALIVAAARPQRTVALPLGNAAVMLANDISGSMTAADVTPSRLVAAQRAAKRFVSGVPTTVRVGSLEFARRPIVLQSPTTDHALTQAAIAQLRPGGGGTAIGDSILAAIRALASVPPQGGKRPPSAILLLSDGGSDVGSSPLAAARQAAALHIPIYTIALGTPNGTMLIKRGAQTVITPVPVSPQTLAQVAALSRGRAYAAADSGKLTAIYAHLATQLGRKHVKQEITASFAGGGLVLLLIGGVLSLRWFGRLT
jgi:Ca-activated chloride channel family protein